MQTLSPEPYTLNLARDREPRRTEFHAFNKPPSSLRRFSWLWIGVEDSGTYGLEPGI